MHKILFLLVFIIYFIAFDNLCAKGHKAIAIVNQEVVTLQELDERIDIYLKLSKKDATDPMKKMIRSVMLNTIINERIYLNEAARRNINITKQEIDNYIKAIDRQNGNPEGFLLKVFEDNNYNVEALRNQLKAELILENLIKTDVLPFLKVSNLEVSDNYSQTFASNKFNPDLVSEMLSQKKYELNVRKMIQNLRNKAYVAILEK